jgi:hypothetical protein
MSNGDRPVTLFGVSGLISGIAANGVLFSFSNPSTAVDLGGPAYDVFRLEALDVEARVISGFTSAQELGIQAHFVKSAAAYTGGTSLSLASGAPAFFMADRPLDSTYDYSIDYPGGSRLSESANAARIIQTTTALTPVGSPVINAMPFAWDSVAELATSPATPKGVLSFSYREGKKGQTFGENAGFIIRAPIALGAGGTIRLFVRALLAERVLRR